MEKSEFQVQDFSTEEKQGSFGHDQLDGLVPGLAKLRFRDYNSELGYRIIEVNVLSIYQKHGQCIVVTDNEEDFDYCFYYNGSEKCFKPNFEVEDYDEVLNSLASC